MEDWSPMMRWLTVALAVVVTLSACTNSAAPSTEPSPELPTAASQRSAAQEAPRVVLDCKRTPATKGGVDGSPVVPPGAVAAQLCGGLVDNAGFNMAWPRDTLRGPAVTRLVERLNGFERFEQPSVCGLVLSAGFDLVLAYPDGSRVRVDGVTSGNCAHLTVQGGQRWTGADQLLRETLALIDTHRRTVNDASMDTALTCPRRWNNATYTAGAKPVEPGDQVTVLACRYRLDPEPSTITQSWGGKLVHSVRVWKPQPLVREAVTRTRVDPCNGVAYDLALTQDILLIQDRHGDTHVVSTAACWANRLSGPRRYPTPHLTRQVASLIS
jgi:hypothetical protein